MKIISILTIFLLANILTVNSEILTDKNLNNNIFINKKTVLITGFESWQLYTPNPSQLIVEKLKNINIRGAEIITFIAPVLWNEAIDIIIQKIIDFKPDIIISLGTGVISSIHVEKIGKNIKSCKEPDNNGKIFLLRKIDPRGSFFRFSTLPVNKIVRKINDANIPVEKSYNAGSFICNEVMYGTLNYIKQNKLDIRAGFIHVPLLISQDSEKGMKIDDMVNAIEIAISACL